jgi:hypothetical protein
MLFLSGMRHVIPLELIRLEEDNYHLAVKSVFESGNEALWVIDTGASKTVFDRSLTADYDMLSSGEDVSVRSAGIGADQMETPLGMLHPFRLGNVLIKPMKAALLDLSHINKLYYHAVEREICGLMGSDFLLENKAVIDYSKLVLKIR